MAALGLMACEGESNPDGASAPDDAADVSGNDASGETTDSVAPSEVEDSVAPSEVEDSVAPSEVEDSVAPGEVEDSVAPGDTEDSGAPGEVEDSVAPGDTEDSLAPPGDTEDSDAPGDADSIADTAETDTTVTDTNSSEVVAAAPALALAGPGGAILAGADDAGGHEVWVAVVRSYVITNEGTAPLFIAGVTPLTAEALNCELSLASAPDGVIAPGQSTSFDVALTLLDEGAALCPFVVASDDPTNAELRVDVTGTGLPSTLPAKRVASLICSVGETTFLGSSLILTTLLATLTETRLDGSLVTTEEAVDGCSITTHVGTLPGGRQVVHAADSASCNTLSCVEAPQPNGQHRCRATLDGMPFNAGGSVTVSLDDELLASPASHTFAAAPGFLTLLEPSGAITRGAPLQLTIVNGVAGTFTQVRVEQDNELGRTSAVCEFPAQSSPVTIPSSVLQRFDDGDFKLYVDMRVRQVSEDPDGYTVDLGVAGFVLPQRSSYTFSP